MRYKEQGCVRYESCHIADARHEAGDHIPPEGAAVNSARLMDNWPDAVSPDNAPYEERNASDRDNDSLHREQVPAIQYVSGAGFEQAVERRTFCELETRLLGVR